MALVPLLFFLELASYVMGTNLVPTRIRGRLGCRTAEFHVEERHKAHLLQPKLVRSVATAESVGRAAEPELAMFNPVLGWDYPPDITYRDFSGILCHHGSMGERFTCTSFRTTGIATYGDSFTYCSQVPDEQTWQTFLAEKLGTNVLNFGVGGYGTDQALLKYEHQDRTLAKIVMLCILPENINRIVNIYRPFYQYDDPLALTKPLFIRDGSGFKVFPNPLNTVWDVAKLDDPIFMKRLGELDYWYRLDQELPPLRFPYILSLVQWRKTMLDQLALTAARVLPFRYEARYPWNLFEEAEPFAIMCHIVDMFVKTAISRGETPIIIIMAHKDYVQELMDYRVSRAAKLVSYMKRKQYMVIDLIQAMATMNPTRKELDEWYEGHATAAGNKITAKIIASNLKQTLAYWPKAGK